VGPRKDVVKVWDIVKWDTAKSSQVLEKIRTHESNHTVPCFLTAVKTRSGLVSGRRKLKGDWKEVRHRKVGHRKVESSTGKDESHESKLHGAVFPLSR